MWPNNFTTTPLTTRTLNSCEAECMNIPNNSCCWLCMPCAFIIDMFTCIPRCVYYKCKENKPVIIVQPL